jgi:glycosyltransferase involved in cell wall biosynthesis
MLLEAMMFAKPVVAADVGGMREIVVDTETGYLVPTGDAYALGASLEALLADPDLRDRLGAAGRRRYEEHYSQEQMVLGASRFYRSVASRAKDRAAAAAAAS